MSQGRKKDEQNVKTPRSDKGDHRGGEKRTGRRVESGGETWALARKERHGRGVAQAEKRKL